MRRAAGWVETVGDGPENRKFFVKSGFSRASFCAD